MSHTKNFEDSILSTNGKNSKIKRPMNAFMLWSKQRRREISKDDPTIHNAQISKLLGEEWKVLPLEDKQPFLKESHKLMVKHKKDHPDYRYKPRKNKQEKVGYSAYNKTCQIPSQAKSYTKYDTHYRYRSPPYHQDDLPHRMSNISKHRPVFYYQPYSSECHVPGCYECEYQRSYEHSASGLYCYHNDAPKECHNVKRHCLCCSSSPSFVPRSSRNSMSSKSKPKSFTVESLIHREYDSHSHSHCESPSYSSHSSASPSSTSPTREQKKECADSEERCKR